VLECKDTKKIGIKCLFEKKLKKNENQLSSQTAGTFPSNYSTPYLYKEEDNATAKIGCKGSV